MKEEKNKPDEKANDKPKEEPAKDKPVEEIKDKKVCQMKKGDYNIHVLIEEVKNLISKDQEYNYYLI